MTTSQSLTVSRSTGDLVIDNNPFAGDYHLPEGGLAYPEFSMRIGYIPDADDVPGKALNTFALDQGTLNLSIYVHSATPSALTAARREIEAAFSQAAYTVAIQVDGEVETYNAFPAWPRWGPSVGLIINGQRAMVATLSVPVNPMGA